MGKEIHSNRKEYNDKLSFILIFAFLILAFLFVIILFKDLILINYWYFGLLILSLFNLILYLQRKKYLLKIRQLEKINLLKENEERFESFMNHFPGLSYIKDENGKILFANEGFYKYLGIETSEIIGMTNYELFPYEFAKKITEEDNAVIAAGKTLNFEESFNGKIWETTKFPINRNGLKPLLAGYTIDITKRKESEEEIIKTNERLKLAQESSNSGLWYWDIATDKYYWSDEFKELFGMDKNTVPGYESWKKCLHPDDIEIASNNIWDSINENKYLINDYRIIMPDKSVKFIRATGKTYYKDDTPLMMVGLCIDITQLKTAEEKLKIREHQQSLILKSLPVVFYTARCTPDLPTMWISEQVNSITGFEPDLFLKDSMFWTKRIHHEDKDKALKEYSEVFKKGSSHSEYRWLCSDGSYHWFSDYLVLNYDEKGIPDEAIGFWVDITKNKRAEESVKEQNLLLRTLIDNSPDLIYYKDTKSRFIAASKSVAKYMGTTHENLIGKTDFEFYTRELAEQFFNDEQNIINTSKPIINKDEPRYNSDGSTSWIMSTKVPLFNDNSEIIGLVGISKDITDRKHIEEALKESEIKFRKVFESAKDAIIMIEENKIIDLNNSTFKLFGYSREEILTKSPLLFSNEFYENGIKLELLLENHISYSQDGDSNNSEWNVLKKDGSIINIELSLSKMNISGKNMILVTMHDITERIKYEEGLRLAKEKAEETNKLKSNFLANMSHELRTPMTGILGFAEILNDSLNDKNDKHKAEIILSGGKRLMNTLNLILDISKAESDIIDVKFRKTNISNILKESCGLFEILAKEKGIELKCSIEENVYANLDEQLAEQVFSNLIKNAITYTEIGFVEINLQKENNSSEENAVIKITDSGIGIPENSLDVIFEPFRQVSEGHCRDFEGTGLGLTLVKKYTELMKGSISVKSKLNRGSEFKLIFPAAENNSTESRLINKTDNREIIPQVSGIKILVVEDDENSILAIEYALKDFCIIDKAETGENALILVQNNKYDLIIMDIGLKGIDGMETTKLIRKINGYEKTPIVAVTAFAMEGDTEKFLAAGCSHYVPKPFNFKDFRNLILNIQNK